MRAPRTLTALALAAALTGAAAGPVLSTASAAPRATTTPAEFMPWLTAHLGSVSPTETVRVAVRGTSLASARAAVAAVGLAPEQEWTSVDTVVAHGLPAAVRALAGQPGLRYVEGDQPQQYTLDTAHVATRSAEALPLYKASDGSRVDGSGISVAVIDSGIDGTHPFFTKDGVSKVVQNRKNICGIVVVVSTNEACFTAPPVNDTDTESAGGHGTHVAGIVAGYEVTTVAPAGTKLRGAAPGAKLVGLSVGAAIGLLDANSAIQWVVDHQRFPCRTKAQQDATAAVDPACPPIRATNHSYGPAAATGGNTYSENSPTVALQRQLLAKGVIPVWAAGNDGGDGSVRFTNPPGMDPTPGVLMVASYNDGQTGNRDNGLSSFSSRGLDGDQQSYPDISAPGDGITSSCRPTLSVCNGEPSFDTLNYQTISGTSMATPYVAGVVAQLFQARPDFSPADIERTIEDSAHKFVAGAPYEADTFSSTGTTTSFDKGHGLVDVMAALASAQGLPAPGAPLALCTPTSLQVEDPAGDASQAVLIDTPSPSQPSLDVTKAWLTWDGTALTFHIRVTDLAAGPPAGSVGEYFRFYVTRGSDAEVYAIANRRATGSTFSLRQFDSGNSVVTTGAFDVANDEIRVVLPATSYGTVIPGQTLAEGDVIAVGQVLGQRDTNGATLTTDTATGRCGFVIGASFPDPDASDVGPTPVVPEAPLALLLPLVAAAVAGATLVSRRRRALV